MPFCTRTTPFIEMLMFCPGAFGFADDEPGDEDELESDGFADAAHGVADSPTPMPSATANAPTRPTVVCSTHRRSFVAAPLFDERRAMSED